MRFPLARVILTILAILAFFAGAARLDNPDPLPWEHSRGTLPRCPLDGLYADDGAWEGLCE